MRLTISKKLNSMIVGLQIASIGLVVALATYLFTEDLLGLLRKGTIDTATMLAGRVRAEMKHVADKARTLGAASLEEYKYDEDKLRFLKDNLAVDSQYIAMGLYRRTSVGGAAAAPSGPADTATKAQTPSAAPDPTSTGPFNGSWWIVHPEFAKTMSENEFRELDKTFPLELELVAHGTVDFRIAKLKDGTPTLRMAMPFVQQKDGTFSQILVIELHQERLTALFAEATAYTSYLVDRRGFVLGSTNPTEIQIGEDLNNVPIVAGLKDAKNQSGQVDFKDRGGEVQIGAYQKVGFADLSVITQSPMMRAEKAKTNLRRKTGFLGGTFVCLALFFSFIFSKSLTGPIQALAQAAEKVSKGDFSVRLKTRANKDGKIKGDEVAEFSATFNTMVTGLEERDRVKATFAKFHSKEMAEKVLNGELKLGGERKAAAVFFSDVRGFTALSEGLDPEALVKILNRYMTRMVRVIMEHGGIVDKYVGDAIMAVWGVPLAKEGDIERALKACLGMRKSLAELNDEFKNEGLPPLKIGMGLNFGPLVSGNIGSEERMEFTVIGDTVNTASRIESLTKEFGTDCLISKEVLDQVPGKFVVEKAHEARVKGKSEPLTVYKLHGYIDEKGAEVLVHTPYSSYTAEKSDKVVHDDKGHKDAPQATALPPPPAPTPDPAPAVVAATAEPLSVTPPTPALTPEPATAAAAIAVAPEDISQIPTTAMFDPVIDKGTPIATQSNTNTDSDAAQPIATSAPTPPPVEPAPATSEEIPRSAILRRTLAGTAKTDVEQLSSIAAPTPYHNPPDCPVSTEDTEVSLLLELPRVATASSETSNVIHLPSPPPAAPPAEPPAKNEEKKAGSIASADAEETKPESLAPLPVPPPPPVPLATRSNVIRIVTPPPFRHPWPPKERPELAVARPSGDLKSGLKTGTSG